MEFWKLFLLVSSCILVFDLLFSRNLWKMVRSALEQCIDEDFNFGEGLLCWGIHWVYYLGFFWMTSILLTAAIYWLAYVIHLSMQ